MHVASERRFAYLDFSGLQHTWCDVDVLTRGDEVLTVLRDQEYGGQSVTNTVEAAARAVREEFLEPLGLGGKRLRWITWSRTDRHPCEVVFGDPEALEEPVWKYVPPKRLEEILSEFGEPRLLARWQDEGSILL